MKLVLRWFPYGDDSVTLKQIKQIPGVSGVATHLTKIPVGDIWTMDEINLVKDEINSYGLEMEVIESLNIHEDIKKGLPSRDMLIDNYIVSMRNLAKAGVKCICYNFMPVMDWYRSNLAKELSDGSTAMAYSHKEAVQLTLEKITSSMIDGSHNFSLPGWEPERFAQMAEDIKFYQNVSSEEYFKNIKYFLDAVVPAAEELDINFAVHPERGRAGRAQVVGAGEEFGVRLQVRFDVRLLGRGEQGGRKQAGGGQENPFHHDLFFLCFSLHSTGVQPYSCLNRREMLLVSFSPMDRAMLITCSSVSASCSAKYLSFWSVMYS